MKLYTLATSLMIVILPATLATTSEKPLDPLDRIWVPAICFVNNTINKQQLCCVDFGPPKGKKMLLIPPLETVYFQTPKNGCTLYWNKQSIPIVHPSAKDGNLQTNITLS